MPCPTPSEAPSRPLSLTLGCLPGLLLGSVPIDVVCDGTKDCADGSDESTACGE